MELRVILTPEAEARLRADADAAGVDLPTYAARLLEVHSAPPRSMLELSGPAYEEFLASRMTDDELGDFLEDVKHQMRAERRRRKQAS
jgi:hypothetical protein